MTKLIKQDKKKKITKWKVRKGEPRYGETYFYIEYGKVYLGVWSETDFDRARVKVDGVFFSEKDAYKKLKLVWKKIKCPKCYGTGEINL